MSGRDAKAGAEVGGKTTTYVVPPEASKNSTSVISLSEWLKIRRKAASKPGSLSILTRTGSV